MPFCLAASITSVPGRASTILPSIVSFTRSGMDWARPLIQVRFEIVPKLLDDRDCRHRRRVAKRAESPSQHIFRQVANESDVAARPHAFMESDEQLPQPRRALTTGNTPSAALVRVEPHNPHRGFH